MKPLVVAATEGEIAPSIAFLIERQIPYLITGAGMTATAYRLGRELAESHPDYILNVGIAGSISRDIPIGSVVEITSDCFSELGAEDGDHFLPIEKLGFGCSTYHSVPLFDLTLSLPKHIGITVNTVHGNENSIVRLRERLPFAEIETMEGAAVFFVCDEENIPCLQIRSISNYVEKRNKDAWAIPLAIKNLNIWLQEFLSQNN